MSQHVSDREAPRVALVTGSLPLGGSTTFLCNLAGELVRRKIATEVLSFASESPLDLDFKERNIPVFHAPRRRLIYEDRLERILQRLGVFGPTAVLATLSSDSFEVLRYLPAGVFRAGVGQSDEPGVYEMMRHYTGCMDLAAAVSRAMKQKMESLPEFAGVPVRYMPYGVPIPEAERVTRREYGRPLRILYLGRLHREQKRVHLFPAILARLRASGIPFHWTVAGDGPERAPLEQAMKDLGPGQTVSFPGAIPYAGVLEQLLAHEVFLLASDYEGLPLSLLEAMGCGLVPVVSDLPSGVREVVDETTGKKVAPENLGGYAEAIIWLHQNREPMRRLSQNARERVCRDFSVGAMTDRWLAALPQNPKSDLRWPARWIIKPILAASSQWRFHPPVRTVRRMLLELRERISLV